MHQKLVAVKQPKKKIIHFISSVKGCRLYPFLLLLLAETT
jgi:hypothetical protein